jgi:hypothetical protein
MSLMPSSCALASSRRSSTPGGTPGGMAASTVSRCFRQYEQCGGCYVARVRDTQGASKPTDLVGRMFCLCDERKLREHLVPGAELLISKDTCTITNEKRETTQQKKNRDQRTSAVDERPLNYYAVALCDWVVVRVVIQQLQTTNKSARLQAHKAACCFGVSTVDLLCTAHVSGTANNLEDIPLARYNARPLVLPCVHAPQPFSCP